MPRRHILTERQRSALLDLPTDDLSLLKHYTLGDDENRLGFALQLCALRYPGRALAPGEMIPQEVLSFIGAQLGIPADALLTYAARHQTRQQHMDALREIYGYKTFSGRGARDLQDWLFDQAEDARSNEDLAQRFVARCRETSTILPAVSTIERLCADALVAAERRIETRIAEKLDADAGERLDGLLTEMLAGNVSRFIWLRNFEIGNNSAAANLLLDRLEFLRNLSLDHQILIDLVQWLWDEFKVAISKQALGHELRTMGYRKLSARPRHQGQRPEDIAIFKKPSPRVWRKSERACRKAPG